MPAWNKLSHRQCEAAKAKPPKGDPQGDPVTTKYSDGGGLYLVCKPSGAKSWVMRIQRGPNKHGKKIPQEVGLGSYKDLTLEAARQKRNELRDLVVKDGAVITEHRAKVAKEQERARARSITFEQAMTDAHAEKSKGWSDKQAASFLKSLKVHAVPSLGAMPVSEIASADIVRALRPIWTAKPQMARKVRGRIVQVLLFSKSNGWRDAPLPHPAEISDGLATQPAGKHFDAMPYKRVPKFIAGHLEALEQPGGLRSSRLALLFTILTAARSGEVRNATWSQIDLESGTWKRPADAMKARREHVVMLSTAALAILTKAKGLSKGDGLIFPGTKHDRPMSDQTMSKWMRAAGLTHTVHGFRSSFRDWAAECMPHMPWNVAELALAHAVGNATERAYTRSDLPEMRRQLAEAWGRFVAPSLSIDGGNVVPLHASA